MCALLTSRSATPTPWRSWKRPRGGSPSVAPPYLTLGALQLELKHPKEGEAALLRYVELVQRQAAAAAAAAAPAAASAPDAR